MTRIRYQAKTKKDSSENSNSRLICLFTFSLSLTIPTSLQFKNSQTLMHPPNFAHRITTFPQLPTSFFLYIYLVF